MAPLQERAVKEALVPVRDNRNYRPAGKPLQGRKGSFDMAYRINFDDCTCCGRCGMKCPQHAIAGWGEVKIDPDKCVDCGLCSSICPLGAIVPGDYVEPETVPHDPIELDCDVVVIGGGAGGLMAAGRAAWLGKKVVVLEKMKKCSGCGWFASTLRMYNSQWQKDRGVSSDINNLLVSLMDKTYWKLDSHLVRNALLGTGAFFDFLGEVDPDRDRCFQESYYVFDGPDSMITPAYCDPNDPAPPSPERNGMGWYSEQQMLKVLAEKGGTVLTRHKAVELVMENGKVAAVVAEDPGGITRVNCKACVMSPGSWIMGEKYLKKYAPEFAAMGMHKSSHTHMACTGDGFPLAEQAGAYIDEENMVMRLMGGAGMAPGRVAGAMTLGPFAVYFNQNGKRWINEQTMFRSGFFMLATALIYQPGGVNYAIFDLDMALEASKRGYQHYKLTPSPIPEVQVPFNSEELRQDLEQVAKSGLGLICADTIEELAEKLHMDGAVLRESIERYNEMCKKGVDEDFFKSPDQLIPFGNGPYYASMGSIATDGAFGGVLVNENIQAYAADKKTLIENLYVPGDFASGRFLNMSGYKVQVLNDLSWALSSGFIAGTHAAEHCNQY